MGTVYTETKTYKVKTSGRDKTKLMGGPRLSERETLRTVSAERNSTIHVGPGTTAPGES